MSLPEVEDEEAVLTSAASPGDESSSSANSRGGFVVIPTGNGGAVVGFTSDTGEISPGTVGDGTNVDCGGA